MALHLGIAGWINTSAPRHNSSTIIGHVFGNSSLLTYSRFQEVSDARQEVTASTVLPGLDHFPLYLKPEDLHEPFKPPPRGST